MSAMSKYLVQIHKSLAHGRALSETDKQYMATLEVDAHTIELSETLGLLFKNRAGEVVYAFGIQQWYSVKRKDFTSIKDVTPSDELAVVKEIM